jgi:hypothetical protein
MNKTLVLVFLVLPVLVFAQHSEFSLDIITPFTGYFALGSDDPTANAIQFELVAAEYLVFLNETFGIGLMVGGGLLSTEQVYPYEGGVVLPLSVSVQVTILHSDNLEWPVLIRAGVLPAFRDFIGPSGGSAGVYFQGCVMTGVVLRAINLRFLVGAATIDFQTLGIRLEAGFNWRYEGE